MDLAAGLLRDGAHRRGLVVAPAHKAPPIDLHAVLRSIYDAELTYVWNALRRLGVPQRDIEDCAHEVFVVVFRKLPELDRSRPLRPWLFAIAFRVASDHRKRASNVRELVGTEREVESEAQNAEDALLASEARRLVHHALQTLDLDQRAVFILHEIDGVEIPAIAEALGIPLNTAYSRLRLARQAFARAARRGPS